MQRRSSRGPHRTTVQDTIAVCGLAIVFYLMFISVAASREPDWPLFWFGALVLVVGFFFYSPCVNVLLDLLGEARAARDMRDAGRGAD
jgi:hypothetical protein